MNYLIGGRQNQIIHIGECVHRPAGPWTQQVHKLLQHLRKKGFFSAPEPLGFDPSGREIVSFLKGEVSNYPLSENASSLNALTSAARLLRKFHDASQSFLATSMASQDKWQFPCHDPQEVVCHGDYAPYNVVLEGEQAIGIIDFDTSHPGPRSWDIAYALYRWSPFTHPKNKDGFGSLEEQIIRARLFCHAYGLPGKNRSGLADLIIKRLKVLIDFMVSEARKGNKTFEATLKDGHHLTYLADIDYITTHKTSIEKMLVE